jgi:hypothetical protein
MTGQLGFFSMVRFHSPGMMKVSYQAGWCLSPQITGVGSGRPASFAAMAPQRA